MSTECQGSAHEEQDKKGSVHLADRSLAHRNQSNAVKLAVVPTGTDQGGCVRTSTKFRVYPVRTISVLGGSRLAAGSRGGSSANLSYSYGGRRGSRSSAAFALRVQLDYVGLRQLGDFTTN